MLFPNNPKIVIIDDEYEDVKGLMDVFSRKGIPYIYFTGARDSQPETPFNSVRLIILDIDLGVRNISQDAKTKASVLATYIKKIISPETMPCVCMFWTRNDELIEFVKTNLQLANFSLIFCTSKGKPTRAQMSTMQMEAFEQILSSAISSEMVDYIIDWENLIQKKASDFVNKISTIANDNSSISGVDWNDSIKNVFSKLTCSYIGANKKIPQGHQAEALEYATYILNQSFAETISKELNRSISINLPQIPSVSLDTIAKLNSILFIEKCSDTKIENGKVFIDNDNTSLFELLKEKILSKKGKNECQSQLVSVILTPSCDLAHNKYLYKDNPRLDYHRTLAGIKIEIGNNIDYKSFFEYAASAYSKKEKIEKSTLAPKLKKEIKDCILCNKPENFYETQPFIDEDGKICIIIFHFGTIQTKGITPENISFSYLLKNSLISDLQTKLANHVNRLGNSMLEC